MSAQFWIKLVLAISALPLAIFAMQAHRRGVFRELRAKWLRRRIVQVLEALVAQLKTDVVESRSENFALFRLRAKLEDLHQHGDPLLDEERARLSIFLSNLSKFLAGSDAGSASNAELQDLLLLGQRIAHESTELGF